MFKVINKFIYLILLLKRNIFHRIAITYIKHLQGILDYPTNEDYYQKNFTDVSQHTDYPNQNTWNTQMQSHNNFNTFYC